MSDKYGSFAQLARHEVEGKDYRIRSRHRSGAPVIIAPHGGSIEPGTSEIADAIAGDDLSFYAFEGIKAGANRILHVTSHRFDEPHCLEIVKDSPIAISIHGENSQGRTVFVGGLDNETLDLVRSALEQADFRVEKHANPRLQANVRNNICNRTRTERGVQLELSRGLRGSLFESLSRVGRTKKTTRFNEFVAAVRDAVQEVQHQKES
jgi:phage replication-related protein YjqB (UPF0714/DUF867 family)